MNAADRILEIPPFSWTQEKKDAYYTQELTALTEQHAQSSPEYRNLLQGLGWSPDRVKSPCDIPYFPVRLFKNFELRSVQKTEIIKTMTSSGTTGQRVSRIFLDKANVSRQTKVLAKICADFLGTKRLPMIVLDTRAVIKDRNLFSARGAGILGFSMLGRQPIYALDEEMNLDTASVSQYIEEHADSDIFLFGFTFMIWEHFQKKLLSSGIYLPLERGILIHGGGWKKLIAESVSNEQFKESLRSTCGIKRVYNYYGMVEQTGSIFMECEAGRLHTSNFSDVIIRRFSDFSAAEPGERGLIQLLSLLPTSYPGHSILTEDEGEITGIDDCPCGRCGKTFKIYGRIRNAEVRGCSDTYKR